VQTPTFFVANGLLSAISDNVFVATVYIIARALDSGAIDRDQLDALAIAINTGTNIPSRGTQRPRGLSVSIPFRMPTDKGPAYP
jgi:NhaB family Na+:H+ antiporter